MDMMFTRQRIAKLVSELDALRLSCKRPVDAITMAPCLLNEQEENRLYEPFENGESWGGRDRHFWFNLSVTLPEDCEGKTAVLLVKTGREGEWDATNPQFLAFINGQVIQGLDVNHRELFLTDKAQPCEHFDISLYAYSGLDNRKAFFSCSTAYLEREVEGLYYDLRVALEATDCFQEEDKRRLDILKSLEETVALIDFRRAHSYHESFLASVREARAFIKRNLYEGCGHEDYFVHGIGSTHIDVAWLWTLSQTREKAARSFATVLELMKRYPEYQFTMSQPQLYQFVKENHPELYDEIKKRAGEGRWEPEGAMWLEADCNLTSGESLVRQIMFGKRFFKEEFGVDSRVLWLPDVFGYSAALPQILKKCGVDTFITSKISWNEYNKTPYDTFQWEGIDGSTVLTHFITTTDPGQDYINRHQTTYNGIIRSDTLKGTWERYQQKTLSNTVLMSYGYGDGGGGPTRDMLEYGRRLVKGLPGLPRFTFGNLKGFLDKLKEQIQQNGRKLPRWVGELYLEYHRGTYTTMARNKRYNRKAELKLMEAEGLYAMLHSLFHEAYPAQELNDLWRTVLLNQFHDIIPGSSIRQVYEESKEQYEKLLASLETLTDKAQSLITGNMELKSESLVVFNPTSFSMENLVKTELPSWCKSVEGPGGGLKPLQRTFDGKTLLFLNVPSKGFAAFRLSGEEASPQGGLRIERNAMENDYYSILLDDQGLIVSIYDKINQREVIKAGEKANKLTAFEDIPHNYDAWDINIYYQQKSWDISEAQSIEVLEQGPIRGTLRITRRFLDSTIIQMIHLYSQSPRIDFSTHIEWKERHLLLKAAFPVDVHTDKAVYDIQFGNVERPTHWNTSWDMARFEVCAHKWADLSENGYGVSLLNDCKYGHDIKDGTIRLTLLKSATSPNEDADREEHTFTYSLLPHVNDFRESTIPQAYALNSPFTGRICGPHQGTLPGSFSFCELSPSVSGLQDKGHIVLETIKISEDGKDLILRLIETHHRRGKVTLTLPKAIKGAWECTLLEQNSEALEWKESELSVEMHPYEIKTLKLAF